MRRKKGEDPDMGATAFADFIANNKEKIRRVAESNTVRNQDGQVVIQRSDPWIKETEWDEFYKELRKSKDQ